MKSVVGPFSKSRTALKVGFPSEEEMPRLISPKKSCPVCAMPSWFTLVMLKSQNEEGKVLEFIEYADVPEMLKDVEQVVENEKALAALFNKLQQA